MAQHSETGNEAPERSSDASLDTNDLNRARARLGKYQHVAELRFKKVESLRLRAVKENTKESLDRVDVALNKSKRSIRRAKWAVRDVTRLIERETQNIAPSANVTNDEYDPAKRGLTIDRAIMLIYAMGGSRIKGLDKGKVATAISYLTGYSVKQFIKRFSAVLPDAEGGIKKFNDQTKAYNEDVRKVCEILLEMGLTNEADNLRQDSGE